MSRPGATADLSCRRRIGRRVPLADPNKYVDEPSELEVYLRADEIDGLAGPGVVDKGAWIEA
jgi:hypothetical protein